MKWNKSEDFTEIGDTMPSGRREYLSDFYTAMLSIENLPNLFSGTTDTELFQAT